MSDNQTDQKYPYGYGLSKRSLIKLYMNKANVMKWSFYLSISGFLILYVWVLLKEHVFNNSLSLLFDGYILALAFFIWGCLGLFWAYRRQVPQVITVKGKPAYIIGMVTMIGCWSIALYSLIIGIKNMMERITQ
jgi:hypothetical protein